MDNRFGDGKGIDSDGFDRIGDGSSGMDDRPDGAYWANGNGPRSQNDGSGVHENGGGEEEREDGKHLGEYPSCECKASG